MKRLKHYHKTIIITFLIIFLSLFNLETIRPYDFSLFRHADKMVHFFMYFSIALIFLFEHYIETWKMNKRDYVMNIYPLLLGGVIEILQSLITQNRAGEWYDFLANLSGILVANIVFHFIKDSKALIWIVKFPFKA